MQIQLLLNKNTYGRKNEPERPTYISKDGLFIDFSVDNLRADSINIIQALMSTGSYPTSFNEDIFSDLDITLKELRDLLLQKYPDKYDIIETKANNTALFSKNSYRFTENEKIYEGSVDGGPHATIGINGQPMYIDKPYVDIIGFMKGIPEIEVKNWEKKENELSRGYLHFEDNPQYKKIVEEVKFITLLVGENYMNTGSDIILYSIKWAYNKVVNEEPTFIKDSHNDLTKEEVERILSIINHDYPNTNYEFYL